MNKRTYKRMEMKCNRHTKKNEKNNQPKKNDKQVKIDEQKKSVLFPENETDHPAVDRRSLYFLYMTIINLRLPPPFIQHHHILKEYINPGKIVSVKKYCLNVSDHMLNHHMFPTFRLHHALNYITNNIIPNRVMLSKTSAQSWL